MRRLALALALAAGVALPVRAQAPGPGPGDATSQVSDLVNALLGSLMGSELTGPELQKEVARVGGVPFRWDVPIDYMSHDDLARYLDGLLADEYPESVARVDERLLGAFDLLEPGTDLRELRRRLLEENVAGFYDERPDRRRLYAVSSDRSLTPMNQIVLAHELRHALQDQYEDLSASLSDDVGDFDDRRIAFLSLLEGDATLVMERFVQDRLGLSGLGPGDASGGLGTGGAAGGLDAGLEMPDLFDLPGAPPVVRDQLVMPYLAGRELARAIVDAGGPDAMVEAWRRPPSSTEQVLHPEKYLSGEAPRPVIPRPDPPGGRLVAEGILGELQARTLVEQDAPAPAAAGWGGDAWRLWDTRGRTALVWTSVWDSADDAAEFGAALRARFAKRHGEASARGAWSVFRRADGWRFAVRTSGETVDLRSAEPGADLDSLLD